MKNLFQAIDQRDDKFLIEVLEERNTKNVTAKAYFRNGIKTATGIAAAFAICIFISSLNPKIASALQQIPFIGKIFYIAAPDIEEKVPVKNQNEEIPSGTNIIQNYGGQDIGDVLHADYITANKYLDIYMPRVYTYINSDGKKEYYELKNNKLTKLKLERKKLKVNVWGGKANIIYNTFTYKNKPYIDQISGGKLKLNGMDYASIQLCSDWLYVYKNIQTDGYSYPFQFDIKTNRKKDILKNIKIMGKSLKNFAILKNWQFINDSQAIVTAGNDKNNLETYLLDLENNTAISINAQTGIKDIVSVKKIEDKIFLMENCNQMYFNYYEYNPETGNKILIYNNATLWEPDENFDETLRIMFTGGQYDFLQDKSGIYLFDELSGMKVTVEGMTQEFAAGVLSITGSSNYIYMEKYSEENFLNLGVIDVKKGCFYQINRVLDSSIQEISISQVDDQLFIQAEDGQGLYYIYQYTPK